jgi:hypothetical protein
MVNRRPRLTSHPIHVCGLVPDESVAVFLGKLSRSLVRRPVDLACQLESLVSRPIANNATNLLCATDIGSDRPPVLNRHLPQHGPFTELWLLTEL